MRRVMAGVVIALLAIPGIASPVHAQTTRPWLGWSTSTPEGITTTADALALQPGAISAYAPFDEPFPTRWADAARERSVPLVLAWEPWDWDRVDDADQSEFALKSIADGRFDAYARTWARGARDADVTILLRFAPEMNGNWRPWSITDTPADFVRAWRHLHDLLAEQGASNVRWAFTPSVEYAGSVPLREFWPGKRYVDWVGADGYNWAGVVPGRPDASVNEVFAETIARLRALAPGKPLMIAECAAGPDTKSRWIPDLLRSAPALGVRLVIWFEHDKETDWRLTTAQLTNPLRELMSDANWRLPA